MMFARFFLPFCTASLIALAAYAQSDPTMDRLNRLERDIQLLQRQVARGEMPADDGGGPVTNAAQLEVRLLNLDEQIRNLRGSIEQTQNDIARLSDAFERFQKDTEFRLSQDGGAGSGTAFSPTTQNLAESAPTSMDEGSAERKPVPQVKNDFPTPRDHYNYAFRLLNQTQYEQAAASFDSFTQLYPKDALVGNAYYWGGETYYIRRDYVTAADYFRQGYEAMPQGPKAADNLYKLALSLNALEQTKEACVVLQQVVAKFKKTATNIVNKAEQEIKHSGCSKV